MSSPASPPAHGLYGDDLTVAATLLAGIRAGGDYLCRLPNCLFKAISGMYDKDRTEDVRPLYRCGGSAG